METSFFNVPSNHRSRTAPSSFRISPVGGKQHDGQCNGNKNSGGNARPSPTRSPSSLDPKVVNLLLRSNTLVLPCFSGELVTAVEAASGDGDPSFLFGVCKEHSSAATEAQCRATMAEKKNNQN
nr:hypothetical protein Iba_chr11fCG3780 [Ipomoea batatas]